MAADDLTKLQLDFIKKMEGKVADFLKEKVPGKFEMVSYPPGFHYNIQPVANYYNKSAIAAFDSTLARGTNGILTLGDDSVTSMYSKILDSATYQYSSNDRKVTQDPSIQNQTINTVKIALQEGYGKANNLPADADYYTVLQSVVDKFGEDGQKSVIPIENVAAAASNLANVYPSLAQAIENSIDQTAPAVRIANEQRKFGTWRKQAQKNSQVAAADNGGMPFQDVDGKQGFVAGWDDLPDNDVLLGFLKAPGGVDISVTAKNLSQTTKITDVGGSVGFEVSPWDLFSVGFKGETRYSVNDYAESGSEFEMKLTYPGLGVVAAKPRILSGDYKTGWYSQSLLQSIIDGSQNPNVSGFKIDDQGLWRVPETFGPGKKFSRLRAIVVSQYPTIKITFNARDSKKVSSDFKETTSVKVKLLGLFTIGSADQSYQVKKVDSTSVAGKVSLELGPPDIKGTVPRAAQVCNVMGGVADYPPPKSA